MKKSVASKAVAPSPKKGIQERQIGIGLVLYDPEQETATLLNLTASVIWRYLGSGRNVASIVDAFDLGFDPASIDRAVVERDVLATLGYFESIGFLSNRRPLKNRLDEEKMAAINDYGMPQIGASYQRPEMKTYSLEQLRSEFGPKAGSTRPGVRFSDTWTPTPA